MVVIACYQTISLRTSLVYCVMYECISGEPCGLPWSSAGESGGEERWDENWYQNLRAALNGLIESFNTSVQAYTQGEHEQYRERELPPHAHAHAHTHNGHHLTARSMTATTGSSSSSSGRGSITNLIKSKGMSKVSIQYVRIYSIYRCTNGSNH